MPSRIHAVSKRGTNDAPEQCSCGGNGVWTEVSPTKRVCTCERCQEVVAVRRSRPASKSGTASKARKVLDEGEHTKRFGDDATKRGCYVRALVASMFQVGLADRVFISASGVTTWVEMKVNTRNPPQRINWWTLLGGQAKGPQDEFIRSVCSRAPDGARVCVTHADPAKWALYQPVANPEYELVMLGRENILGWVCR